jgi:urease alpha subunit
MIGGSPDPVAARSSSPDTIIRNATIVTMNDRLDIIDGDVRVRAGRIASIGGNYRGKRQRTNP